MKLRRLLVFVASAGLLTACGGSSPAASGGGASGNIDATLHEWSIDLTSNTAPAGDVTFNISNTGEEEHEFVVVKTDLAEDKMPYVDDEIPEDSSDLEFIDEAEDIGAGTDTTLTLTDLAPGHYVIFCNLLAHYGKGMHATLTVE